MEDRAEYKTTKDLTNARHENYEPPLQHFATTSDMVGIWKRQRSFATVNKHRGLSTCQESALAHGVYMILDKLARAAYNPQHLDNWDDVAGYAACIKEMLECE